jgi:hypothetical protein
MACRNILTDLESTIVLRILVWPLLTDQSTSPGLPHKASAPTRFLQVDEQADQRRAMLGILSAWFLDRQRSRHEISE